MHLLRGTAKALHLPLVVPLLLPPIPATDNALSSISKVFYVIQVHGWVSGHPDDINIQMPIKIGTNAIVRNSSEVSHATIVPRMMTGVKSAREPEAEHSQAYSHPTASIKADLRTQRSEYQPGEIITAAVKVENESTHDISLIAMLVEV